MANPTELLNDLAHWKDVQQHKTEERDALIDQATPDAVKQKIAEIKAEYDQTFKDIQAKIMELEFDIKQAVYVRGETIKADHLMAVFTKGRQSWDNKGLDAYSEIHPEVLKYRKIGEPSVSIRAVK